MKATLPMVALCFTMALVSAFTVSTPDNELEKLINRMNTELPTEGGCSKAVYTFNGCTLNIALECGGNELSIDLNMNELQRVYMNTADAGDEFKTVFFHCGRGSTCISGNGGIPDQPAFPIRLAKGQEDDLGQKIIDTFGKLIGNCKN